MISHRTDTATSKYSLEHEWLNRLVRACRCNCEFLWKEKWGNHCDKALQSLQQVVVLQSTRCSCYSIWPGLTH